MFGMLAFWGGGYLLTLLSFIIRDTGHQFTCGTLPKKKSVLCQNNITEAHDTCIPETQVYASVQRKLNWQIPLQRVLQSVKHLDAVFTKKN